jgi:glycosyltransferase involved in cell wall biosynthesis
MRIALLTDGIYPYVTGGMQKHSFYIAKYLAKNKVYIDLYHATQNKEYDIKKLEFFTEAEKQYIKSVVVDFPLLTRFPGHYLRESYLYSVKIADLLKSNLDVDFIYAKGFSGWRSIEEKKKGLKCPPIGVKFHGLNMFQPPPSFRGWLEGFMFRPPALYNLTNADFVFSYGGKITDITIKTGVPPENILEIPTGIDATWLKEPLQKKSQLRKFIFVGRYDKLKGIKELTQAIRNLIPKNNFELHFIGPIPEIEQIKSKKVIYWGQINDMDKIKSILSECDVLLCPSYSEGMPNVIIEAMGLGLAVIATDVGAINCLVSERNGWLIEKCSVNRIEKAFEEAIRIPDEKLSDMKRASYNFTRDHLIWDKIAGQLIQKISVAIGKHP